MFKRIAAVTAATILIFVGGSRDPEAERAEIIVAAEDPETAAGRETKREAGTIEKDKEADVNDTKGTQTAVDRTDEGLGSASVEGTGGNHGGEEPAAAEDDSAGYIDVSGGEVQESDAGQAGVGDASDAEGYPDGAEIPNEALEEDSGASGEDSGEEVTPQLEYLGDWTISFYCPCENCCGEWAYGPAASGVMPTAWWTAATDSLEFGTILYVDGLGEFEVQDRGTDYGWLDVFVGSHEEALANGLQTRNVWIVR